MLALYLTYVDDESEKITFADIYLSYRKQMVTAALAIMQNESDAEDVVEDVFLNIATRHMKTIMMMEDKLDVRNYLLVATKNTALNWLKKRKRVILATDEKNMDYVNKNTEKDALIDMICQKMDYEELLNAIKDLEPKYREVLYYHYVLEIPVMQVAKSLKQTVAATKKQLVRGKKKLLSVLDEKEGNYNGND